MQRTALLSSRPQCPLHPQAKVWRDGFGGRVHLRQRFKCVQADGTKHVFSEPIPGRRRVACCSTKPSSIADITPATPKYRCRILTNRRRTDRLLALIQLDLNGAANLRLYRRLIKEHLQACADGRPAKQRLITERLVYRRKKIGSGLRRPLTADELEQVGL